MDDGRPRERGGDDAKLHTCEWPLCTQAVSRYDDLVELIDRLRQGDEAAFRELFDAHHAMLVRLATAYVKSASVAEEVAQDTWTSVIDALPSFEGRSALKTWIARIAINRAKTRAQRDGRQVPLDDEEPQSQDDRFNRFGAFRGTPPDLGTPEALLLNREVRVAIDKCLEGLPEQQRAIVTLRDIEGWSSEEVCNVLGLSESNQRVLLHRGRGRLRAALEAALGGRS
jgi:RNA polymerase sigma-70 factor (ECF subfamily)